MFQQTYGNMQTGINPQYNNYNNNPSNMMQGNIQPNPQMMQNTQSGLFQVQQQGFSQPRGAQSDYRAMPQGTRPAAAYMQQAPNVTMNTIGAMNAAAQSGPAPPYSRTGAQGIQGNMQQQSQYQQQQQRMRQQMLAMQQQGGPQGPQPSPALVAHLQRQMNPNPYPHQPPPYNMGWRSENGELPSSEREQHKCDATTTVYIHFHWMILDSKTIMNVYLFGLTWRCKNKYMYKA